MIPSQNTKMGVMIAPVDITTALQSATVDCIGWDYAVFSHITATANNTTSNPVVWRLSEGETTSAFTTWAEAVGDGVGGFTIGDADTANGHIHAIHVDLTTRERYIQCEIDNSVAQLGCVTVQFFRGEEPGTTAAAKGLATFAIA